MPIVGKTIGQGAFYSDKDHKSILILASFGEAFGPQFKDQILQGLQSGQSQKQSADKNGNKRNLRTSRNPDIERTIQARKPTLKSPRESASIRQAKDLAFRGRS